MLKSKQMYRNLTTLEKLVRRKNIMSKSDRTKTKDLIPQIKEIQAKGTELRTLVENLPDSSVKDAFIYSVSNIETKVEKFLTVKEKFSISEEEKAILEKIRTGKIKVQEVSATSDKVVKKKH